MVTWFAGLFYLPRLFVYHARPDDLDARKTLKIMERKLMVMTHIGGALTWLFGILLVINMPYWLTQGWLQVKLGLVVLLVFYHWWCLRLVRQFACDEIHHGHVWFRWFNEFPTVILIAAVTLAVFKPF
jgi:putative membrane protein